MVKAFSIKALWPRNWKASRDPVEASFCGLKINIKDTNVTSFKDNARREEACLELPSYYIAEWIAENWWPLLWEPRKTDTDGDEDQDYTHRHSILTAQHGFILPAVSFIPTGENVSVHAKGRTVDAGEIQFTNTADVLASRAEVQAELGTFVDEVLGRLTGSPTTPLHEAWTLVRETDPGSVEFCKLIGALGLSPYETHESVERALDAASSILSPKQLMDLCLTATADDFVLAAAVAAHLQKCLPDAPEIDLSPLGSVPAPRDALGAPAWRTGYQAADQLRIRFQVEEQDVHGAEAIFERLNISTAIEHQQSGTSNDAPVIGATERSNESGKLALVQNNRSSRRFSAARATYFLWTSTSERYRLITSAVTRDQQASRAFAAELLAPQSYIRSQATSGRLSSEQIAEIATKANVAPEVIRLQAANSGLQVVY